jgi:hypothetical protein
VEEFTSLITPQPLITQNEATLSQALNKTTGDNGDIIILNVNALNSGFQGNDTNHWVGIKIDREKNRVLYIDPLGQEINQEIQAQIKEKFSGYKIERVFDGSVRPQHANKKGQGDFAYLEGNDTDCGPLLIDVLQRLNNNDVEAVRDQIGKKATDVARSQQYGKELRTIHAKAIDPTNTIPVASTSKDAQASSNQLIQEFSKKDQDLLQNSASTLRKNTLQYTGIAPRSQIQPPPSLNKGRK